MAWTVNMAWGGCCEPVCLIKIRLLLRMHDICRIFKLLNLCKQQRIYILGERHRPQGRCRHWKKHWSLRRCRHCSLCWRLGKQWIYRPWRWERSRGPRGLCRRWARRGPGRSCKQPQNWNLHGSANGNKRRIERTSKSCCLRGLQVLRG